MLEDFFDFEVERVLFLAPELLLDVDRDLDLEEDAVDFGWDLDFERETDRDEEFLLERLLCGF